MSFGPIDVTNLENNFNKIILLFMSINQLYYKESREN